MDETLFEENEPIDIYDFVELLEKYYSIKDDNTYEVVGETDVDFGLFECATNFDKVFHNFLPFCGDYGYEYVDYTFKVYNNDGIMNTFEVSI